MPKLALSMKTPPERARGFSLVELTIVLIIVGLLLGSLITPLSAQIEQRNYNETQQQIAEIREALIGYAVANGRLPRPATSASDGIENPASCSDDDKCTGFVPWATLGVRKTDAWNKMIRYSVAPELAGPTPFTLETLKAKSNKKVQTRDAAGTTSYLVGGTATCSATSPCAPAIIYSAGKSNWGYADDGSELADASSTNADEDSNAAANKTFFAREQSTVPTGGEFDDLVVWLPPFVLINRLIAAGRLP